MPDDTTMDTAQDTSATAATTADANTSGADNGENGGDGGFKPITSEAELTAWKEATRKSMVADARKAAEADVKRRADDAAAKAKGDFEKLATDRQAEIDRLTAAIAERDRNDLKRTVAAKHKLNAELAARLVGDTEAELEADAKALAKLVGAREAPDTEAGAGAKGASSPSDRPIPKKLAEGQKTPAYTFDGRPKVAWPNRS